MIHRYNLADLNLPERMEKAPANLSFKGRTEIKENQEWMTTSQNAFGTAQHLDA
jgi:hypothetical protein